VSRAHAAIGSFVFLFVGPGVVDVVVPWALTRWEVHDFPLALRVVGVVLIAAGAAVLLHGFWRFVVEGIGTPSPARPTQNLVVGGAYRYVRNPIYLANTSIIVGQGLLLGQLKLLVYGVGVLVLFTAFVRFYEEPTLRRKFGEEYEDYCRRVPGWWPRRPAQP
jgi:protein-S-isoprenylcysteine O-methyltransferase Ste14